MIRDIGPDDFPWVFSLAQQRYEGYDQGGALQALATAVRIPTAIAWRTDHGFLVANTTGTLWYPKRRALEILALCVEEGHHWDAVKLLRASVAWARDKGCERWLVNSDTQHQIGSLAVRAGAMPEPRYVIDLTRE